MSSARLWSPLCNGTMTVRSEPDPELWPEHHATAPAATLRHWAEHSLVVLSASPEAAGLRVDRPRIQPGPAGRDRLTPRCCAGKDHVLGKAGHKLGRDENSHNPEVAQHDVEEPVGRSPL